MKTKGRTADFAREAAINQSKPGIPGRSQSAAVSVMERAFYGSSAVGSVRECGGVVLAGTRQCRGHGDQAWDRSTGSSALLVHCVAGLGPCIVSVDYLPHCQAMTSVQL